MYIALVEKHDSKLYLAVKAEDAATLNLVPGMAVSFEMIAPVRSNVLDIAKKVADRYPKTLDLLK